MGRNTPLVEEQFARKKRERESEGKERSRGLSARNLAATRLTRKRKTYVVLIPVAVPMFARSLVLLP